MIFVGYVPRRQIVKQNEQNWSQQCCDNSTFILIFKKITTPQKIFMDI